MHAVRSVRVDFPFQFLQFQSCSLAFFLQEQYYLWMCYKERLQTMLCTIKRCPIIFSLAAQESLDKSMHMSVQVLH